MIIVIHGLRRSGKGVVSDYLAQRYGFVQEKYARVIKDMTAYIISSSTGINNDIIIERFIDGDLKEIAIPALYNKSARYIMQTLYKEWASMISIHMWHDIAEKQIISNTKRGLNTVVDDLRCIPGYEVAVRNGAKLWLVRKQNRTISGSENFVFKKHICHMDLQNKLSCMLDIFFQAANIHDDRHIDFLGNMTRTQIADTFVAWFDLIKKDVNIKSTTSKHISEQEMNPSLFDAIINNDGTFSDLHKAIDMLVPLV